MNVYVRFELAPQDARKKTATWFVLDRGVLVLGEIKWFPHWRCYAFFPKDKTLYEQDCLRVIADFCETRTTTQRLIAQARRDGNKNKS